ncbi:hypothetical protein ACOSQ2_026241 [Xanthoceras sorbifolium]
MGAGSEPDLSRAKRERDRERRREREKKTEQGSAFTSQSRDAYRFCLIYISLSLSIFLLLRVDGWVARLVGPTLASGSGRVTQWTQSEPDKSQLGWFIRN